MRASITCDTPTELLAALQKILADPSVGVLRLKNRLSETYNGSASGGFRNLSLNLIIADDDTRCTCTDTHIAEIQLDLTPIAEVKTLGGHKRYVKFRDGRAE